MLINASLEFEKGRPKNFIPEDNIEKIAKNLRIGISGASSLPLEIIKGIEEKYKIPAGAEKYLRPYVESGSKFFVAKVNRNLHPIMP